MKKLLLLRHAKSSHKQPRLWDHDRPLAPRGEEAAPLIGKLLVAEGIVPDLIVSSTAARTRQTAELVTEACGYEGNVSYQRSLYLAEPEQYITIAAKTKKSVACLMFIGHNPAMTDLKEMLTGDDQLMPTAALALITLDISDWRELSIQSSGTLDALWLPRNIDLDPS